MHKAQGFDVFKLLISAVVAVVLLTILLNILQNVNIDSGQSPIKKSKDLTKDALSSLNTAQFYSGVKFKKGTVLTSYGIAAASDELTADDVCLVLDSRLPESIWEVEDNKKIAYKGSSPISAKITVLCGYSDTVNDLGIQDFFEQSTIGYQVDDFGGCTVPDDSSKYCIVAIKRAD